MDAIVPPRYPRHPFLSPTRKLDTVPLLLPLFGSKTSLKLLGFCGAEIVTAPDDIGSVCVVGRVEGGEQGEHFRRVPAAAENDEKMGWCPAFACRWTGAVDGGEDVDETELEKVRQWRG